MSSDDTRLGRLGKRGRSLVSAVPPWLVGRNPTRTLTTVFLAAVGTLAVAAGVGMTAGSDRIADAAVETWRGATVHYEIIAVACLLVGVAAVGGALNTGLIPTFSLVASVPFGVGLARYGTEYAVGNMTLTVSLPEAIADGLGAALVIGLPLAVLGYLVGTVIRRVGSGNQGNSGSPLRPDRS